MGTLKKIQLDTLIAALELKYRDYNVLKLLHVKTVSDLIKLNPNTVLNIRGKGTIAQQRIKKIQKKYNHLLHNKNKIAHTNIYKSQPPYKQQKIQLPQKNDENIKSYSYISRLAIDDSTAKVLRQLRLTTLDTLIEADAEKIPEFQSNVIISKEEFIKIQKQAINLQEQSIVLNYMRYPIKVELMEASRLVYPNESVLSSTLIQLFGISEIEYDYICSVLSEETLRELCIDSKIWEKISIFGKIFQDDKYETIFNLSVGKLINIFNGIFDKIFKQIQIRLSVILKRKVELNQSLFYTKPICNIESPIECGDFNLNLFDLPKNILNILFDYGLKTIADINMVSEKQIIQEDDLSEKSLGVIRAIWESIPYVKSCIQFLKTVTINRTNSFEQFIINGFEATKIPKKKYVIGVTYLLDKCSIGSKPNKITLEALATPLKLTRERIRQIVSLTKRNLHNPVIVRRMDQLCLVLYNILCSNGGIFDLKGAAGYVKRFYSWSDEFCEKHLKLLLECNSQLVFDTQSEIIAFASNFCIKCEKFKKEVFTITKFPKTDLTLYPLNDDIKHICAKCSKCAYINDYSILTRYHLKDEFHKLIIVHEGKMYFKSNWNLNNGQDSSPVTNLLLWLNSSNE
jgi:hypothetical protein